MFRVRNVCHAMCVRALTDIFFSRNADAESTSKHVTFVVAVIYFAPPFFFETIQFALRELQGLSDTGIFRTLSLKRISAAAAQVHAIFRS